MTLLKKCCYCLKLRTGALIVAYLTFGVEVFLPMTLFLTFYEICGKILVLVIFAAIWNCISAAILLISVHRNNPKLIPLHLVMHLGGLILDMISHMVMASRGTLEIGMMVYAFFCIGFITADIVIVLSYYQSEL